MPCTRTSPFTLVTRMSPETVRSSTEVSAGDLHVELHVDAAPVSFVAACSTRSSTRLPVAYASMTASPRRCFACSAFGPQACFMRLDFDLIAASGRHLDVSGDVGDHERGVPADLERPGERLGRFHPALRNPASRLPLAQFIADLLARRARRPADGGTGGTGNCRASSAICARPPHVFLQALLELLALQLLLERLHALLELPCAFLHHAGEIDPDRMLGAMGAMGATGATGAMPRLCDRRRLCEGRCGNRACDDISATKASSSSAVPLRTWRS